MLWGLTRVADEVDVTVAGGQTGKPKGVHVHRTRRLDAQDVRIHRGLPVTSPARTLLDNAARGH